MIESAFNNSSSKSFKTRGWLPVIILITVAILVRLYITSGKNHYLLAGSDGPYFALQVKSLLENFRLGYADMPLLFFLGAFVAKILLFLHIAPEKECILLAVRFIDAFLPPLVAIPVFLISKELAQTTIKQKRTSYLMVAFSILSFTPLVIFSYQLQKNALAIVWIFFFIYFLIKILKYDNRNDFYKAVVILFLCALTHFGSFGILVFLSILVLVFWMLINRRSFKIQLLKKAGLVAIVLITLVSLVAVFDFTRFQKLIYVPFKIFEALVLLYALNGQNFLLKGRTLVTLIISNMSAIIVLGVIIQYKRNLNNANVIIGFALVACTLLVSTPMLGLEWANRLFMMAYIPLTVLYLIIFNVVSTKWIKIPSIVILFLLIAYSIFYAVMSKPIMSITNPTYTEFEQIKQKVNFQLNDAVVGRQDLRLLASWVYGTKGISDYLLTKDEFNKFNAVYLYKQINGINQNLRGVEATIPDNTTKVFQGNYFEVYKLNDNTNLKTEKDKIFKGIRGSITTINENTILTRWRN